MLASLSVFCLVGCDNGLNEKTGLSCVTGSALQLVGQSGPPDHSADFIYAPHYKMESNQEYVSIPTHITGENKLITLKNESNCSERIDTDNLGEADSYMTVNETFLSLRLQHGENRVRYTVQKCESITPGHHQCVGELDREEGTLIVEAP
jgi:hypothetical protein